MRVVVADTSPINYLILTGYIDVLPALFEKVILPSVVRDELEAAPRAVADWIAFPPAWVEVLITRGGHNDSSLQGLDAGEVDAIALAMEIGADLLLMDDRDGVLAARRKGLTVTGTLGILGLAAQQGALNLGETFARIKRTNFRYRQAVMDALLRRSGKKPLKAAYLPSSNLSILSRRLVHPVYHENIHCILLRNQPQSEYLRQGVEETPRRVFSADLGGRGRTRGQEGSNEISGA